MKTLITIYLSKVVKVYKIAPVYLNLFLSLRIEGKPFDPILHEETNSPVRCLSQATQPPLVTSPISKLVFQKGLYMSSQYTQISENLY